MNCREALAELIALKDLKLLIEMARKHPIGTALEDMSTDYRRRKPIAWANARAALAEEEQWR